MKKVLGILFLGVLVLFSAMSVSSARAEGDGPLFRNGTITGTVTDEDGFPLEGIEVTAGIPSDYDGDDVPRLDSIASGFTDANGVYEITGLSYRSYILRFANNGRYTQEGFVPGGDFAPVYYGNSASIIGAWNTGVSDPRPRIVNMTMQRAGKVTGALSGIVDGETRPFASGSIYAYRYNGTGWEDMGGTRIDSTADQYEIKGLPTGSYRFQFSGHVASDVPGGFGPFVNFWYENGTDLASATTVNVNAGQTTANKDIAYTVASPNVSISGRVTSESGQPLDVLVELYTFSEEWQDMVASRFAATDENGNYAFTDLPPNTYYIYFTPRSFQDVEYAPEYRNGALTLGSSEPLIVTETSQFSGIDAVLEPESVITGRFSNVEFGSIQVWRWNGWDAWLKHPDVFSRDYFSGDEGFAIDNLSRGEYRLEISGRTLDGTDFSVWYADGTSLETAETIGLGVGETVDLGDITIEIPMSGNSISGKVTNDAGQLVPTVSVTLFRIPESGQLDIDGLIYFRQDRVEWNDQGMYQFTNLPAGQYVIDFDPLDSIHLSEWSGSARFAESAEIITVGENSVIEYSAELVRGAFINGFVNTSVNLDNIQVNLEENINGEWVQVNGDSFTLDYRQPYYNFGPHYPGEYRIHFEGITEEYREDGYFVTYATEEWYDNAYTAEDATTITLTTGQTLSNLNVEIGENPAPDRITFADGVISGRVTNEQGESLPGMTAHLYQITLICGGKYSSACYESYYEVATATTTADGSYTFAGLQAADYQIGYSDSTFTYQPLYYIDTVTFADAQRIEINADNPSVSGLDVQMKLWNLP